MNRKYLIPAMFIPPLVIIGSVILFFNDYLDFLLLIRIVFINVVLLIVLLGINNSCDKIENENAIKKQIKESDNEEQKEKLEKEINEIHKQKTTANVAGGIAGGIIGTIITVMIGICAISVWLMVVFLRACAAFPD